MSLTLHLDAANPSDIACAADILRSGGTVAFPTETVYGLGANALAPEAVARIFTAKQRPAWDPLIVHVPDYASALALVDMDPDLRRRVDTLAAAFWPGPLTLLLPRRSTIPDAVTAGRPLVGIRIPSHPAALALLRATGLPLAAPSANRFGHTSPTTAQHVLDDLDGRIDAVLDAGSTPIGLESTVLDPAFPDPVTPQMTIYRPGGVSPQQLQTITNVPVVSFKATIGETSGDEDVHAALPAPGVGLRHYAPNARLILVEGSEESLRAALTSSNHTSRRGVLLPTDWELDEGGPIIQTWAAWTNADALAATLFAGLRALDACGVEVIYCPLPPAGGVRNAIRDRLEKAARKA